MKESDRQLYYLVDHLVKTIDLPSFIESETDQKLKWARSDYKARCHCPMPDHHDTNASFTVTRINDIFIFHCFGCNKKGTIVHFCMDYFGLRNKLEAILFLCKKYNIKNKEDIILAGIKNITKKVDMQRKIENTNIVNSNQCRLLLRKDFEKNSMWVAEAYKTMNQAMGDDDYDALEKIGYEASKRMRGLNE